MKIRLIFVLVILVLGIVFLNPQNSLSSEEHKFTNWPLQRMDAQNTAFTNAEFPSNMEFSDFLPIESLISPIIANNRYFLIDASTGFVHCFDIESQELIWKEQYYDVFQDELRTGNACCFSEETNQLMLLETIKGTWDNLTGFVSRIYAINPDNGEVNWKNDIRGYCSNSITVSDGIAVARLISITKDDESNYQSVDHILYGYSLETGELKWKTPYLMGGDPFGITNLPAIGEEYIVSSGSNCCDFIEKKEEDGGTFIVNIPCFINLVDKDTGLTLDHVVLDECTFMSTPLLENNRLFVVTNSHKNTVNENDYDLLNKLLCFEIVEDKLVLKNEFWLSDKGHDFLYMVCLSKHGNSIFFLDYSGLLVCISTDTGDIMWNKKVGKESSIGPYFCNTNYLIICTRKYLGHRNGKRKYEIILQYLDPKNGDELFLNSVPFDGDAPRELVGTDNHIWAKCGYQIAHFTPAVPNFITVSPSEINESCFYGEKNNIEVPLTIDSKGDIDGTVKCTEDWVSLETNKISRETKTLKVILDHSGMEPGEYHSSIIFKTNIEDVTVPVTLNILERPKLSVTPSKVMASVPYSKILNDTVFTLSITGVGLEGSIECKEEWLKLSHNVINDDLVQFTAKYSIDTKEPGIYSGDIVIKTNGNDITIPIEIKVLAKPSLQLLPNKITQQIAIGAKDIVYIELINTGGEGLSGTITSDQDWLMPSKTKYDDDLHKMTFLLDAKNFKAGTYHGTVTFEGNDQIIEVPVTIQCIVWITFHIGSKTVEVNKVEETISSAPYLFEGRSYVPVRKLVESLPLVKYLKNAEMIWDPVERKVTINVGEKKIELWIGSQFAKINGKEIQIDPNNDKVSPQIKEGRTFLPLRFTAENLGYQVEWEASTQAIHLKYIVKEE